MDEAALKSKLATIVALPVGASAAQKTQEGNSVRKDTSARLKDTGEVEPEVEFQFSLTEDWQRQLFAALARRHGLRPFRLSGQRQTTVMLRAPERFIDETFWPQYEQLAASLRGWLEEVTGRVISEVLQEDGDVVEERADAPHLSPGTAEPAV
jgi:hypothetical protein